jgi:hypothetical protein
MPVGVDVNTGRVLEFDVCSSETSLNNHVSPGQVLEGRWYCSLHDGFHGKCIVLIDGVTVLATDDGTCNSKPLECTHGMVNMWQLNHCTYDKLHYTHNQLISTNVEQQLVVPRAAG